MKRKNPGSGVDLHIGNRKKHFDTEAEAYRYALDARRGGLHSEFTIVDVRTGIRREFSRAGKRRNPTPVELGRMRVLRIRLERERNSQKPSAKKIEKMMAEYRELEKKPNPRRNPEAAAKSMREAFTGLPSKKSVIVARDIHVHGHLAKIGELVELRGKTVKGEKFEIDFTRASNPRRKAKGIGRKVAGWVGRRAKAVAGVVGGLQRTWINPKAKGPVLLASNEAGSHLFIEGGDQSLDLSKVGLDAKGKESVIVGPVTHVTYHARKKFDGKEEEHDYEHKFSEDSGGPLPQLRYDVKNKHLFLDGGVYHIPRALFGASQGITD